MPQNILHAPKAVKNARTVKKSCTIYDDKAIGKVQISEDVIAVIAALAATEVDGVAHISGGITHEKAAKVGARSLAKGVKIELDEDDSVVVRVIIIVTYGCSIPDTTLKVQKKIKSTLETMTGLDVREVHVSVSDVAPESE